MTFNYNIYVNHAFNTHGNKQVRLHTFACGWNHTWKLHHNHGSKKVGLHYLYVLQIGLGNYIDTPLATKSWVASICMWCKSNLKIVLTPYGSKKVGLHPLVRGANQTWILYQHPMAVRKLDCIHLYVVQIKPKTTSKLNGSTNFDNFWKKI